MSTVAAIRESRPITTSGKGAFALLGSSFRTIFFNPFNLGFSLAMPIFMYLIFGASQEYGDIALPSGNVRALVLARMALFGVLLATASFGASVSIERTQGVSRLFALTPLSPSFQILARLAANVAVALILLVATYLVGVFTGAEMTGAAWAVTGFLTIIMTLLSSAIGFACGFAIRSDSAYAATSAIMVLSAFAGGTAMPLEQMGSVFERIAPWTPLWGVTRLIELPLTGWDEFTLAMAVNALVWTAIATGVAIWGLRRDTNR